MESDDDIFDRTITIDKIASIVKGNSAGKSFTISLVGSWGSGKSTILKCVKRKVELEGREDIIFVDNFQPWIYKDADKMVVEFGYALLNKIGYKKSFASSRIIANAFLKTTSKADLAGILSQIKLPEIKEDPIEIINNYLLGHNKKLIIVLDNLERCEPEEIIRFLRIIKNHLRFNNSYYIFSYDEEVMKNSLTRNELDKMFLDKFSQCIIPVPEIPEEKKKEVISKCFDNYYQMTGREKGSDYNQLLSVISTVITTPRGLVHAINSAYVGDIGFLNQTDSILLNILKQNAPNLYSVIRDNRNKFTYSSSSYFDVIMSTDHDRDGLKNYCEEEATFFKEMLEDKENAPDFIKYRPIISHLLPSVNVFMSGQNNQVLFETGIISGGYEQSYGGRRICRDELFELYFTQAKNKHIEICEKVDEILKQAPKAIADLVVSYTNNLDSEAVRDVLQHLKERISSLDSEKKDDLALNILGIVLNLRGGVETKDRAILDWLLDYLANALTTTSQPVFEKILSELKHDYRNLGVLNSLEKQMRNLDRRMMASGRFMPIYQALEEMKREITNQEINIYKKNTYSRFNIRMLDGNDVIINYLKKIKDKVPKRNQILILADFVYWGGTGGRNLYEIDDKIVGSVFSDEEIADIIKNAKSGELKNAIKKIYSEANNKKMGYSQGDRTYYGPEKFDLFGLCEKYIND